ncbi:MAG TPA: TIGR01777 family oxidoreductase [Gemmataceae bacterium]|jgi:hypothetical protein|nr:TIGR01777 family oxidoreductase [Gemmataceae bacterium]
MRVFVTGGTGLIGTRLVRQLLKRGDQPVVLTRRPDAAAKLFGPACTVVAGDPTQSGAWVDAVADCDAVVNLAGENVFGRRWNAEVKALLNDSRVKATQNVVEALRQQTDGRPRTLVNASAIGYYGPHGDEELTEDSPPGDDFLARICIDWEKAALAVESAGVRCVTVRVGVVLDKEGGALAKLLTPFKLGAGGPVGSGKQWMSWIHHEDMTGLFLLALDDAGAAGPLNGTAPEPVTNRDFGRALGGALRRPAIMPMPGFALRLLVGEAAEVVLGGQRVLPRRAQQLGYVFKYPTIDAALREIVG